MSHPLKQNKYTGKVFVTTIDATAGRDTGQQRADRERQVDWRHVRTSVARHVFNRQLCVLCPAAITSRIARHVDAVASQPSFVLKERRLADFLTGARISKLCRAGAVDLRSIGNVDADDCFCISSAHADAVSARPAPPAVSMVEAEHGTAPKKRKLSSTQAAPVLTLHLRKDSYERAGLDGQRSALNGGKYVVNLPFKPLGVGATASGGTTGATETPLAIGGLRALKCIQETPALAKPRDCTATVDARAVEGVLGCKGDELNAQLAEIFGAAPTELVVQQNDVAGRVPHFALLLLDDSLSREDGLTGEDGNAAWARRQQWQEYQEDVHTHLSLLARSTASGYNAASSADAIDPFISTYAAPRHADAELVDDGQPQQLICRSIDGTLSSASLLQLVEDIKQALEQDDAAGPAGTENGNWVCIQIVGEPRAPIAWHPTEHGAGGLDPHHSLTLLMFRAATTQVKGELNAVFWEATGDRDIYSS